MKLLSLTLEQAITEPGGCGGVHMAVTGHTSSDLLAIISGSMQYSLTQPHHVDGLYLISVYQGYGNMSNFRQI